jgi:hypothetical protein
MAPYDYLSSNQFVHQFKTANNGSVTVLFFAYSKSIPLAQRFRNILVIDCTYKTNKYGMQLLNVVGITSTYSTFNVAFAFLCEETVEEYKWALECLKQILTPSVIVTDRELVLMSAISSVYPAAKSLLCLWHINNNVLANSKKMITSNDLSDQSWYLVPH